MLRKYVADHTERGDCTCGKCFDAPVEGKQPIGHTVNLTFFEVATKDCADKVEFMSLVEKEYPRFLDGKEHSYIEVGGEMGDQGIALMTIGLGHLLGVWQAGSPDTMMPFLPQEMKMQMAGQGMVTLQYLKDENEKPKI